MRTFAHRSLSLPLLLLLSACSHPTSESITKFSEATVAISSVVSSAVDVQVEFQQKANTVVEATLLIDKVELAERKSSTNDPNASTRKPPPDYVFPPPEGVFLRPQYQKDWGERVTLLKSIAAYAKALAEANDPALTKPISEATTNVSVALGNFQSAMALRRSQADAAYVSERTQLIGAIVGEAATFAAETYSAAQIRSIMSRVHKKLERATVLLKADLKSIVYSLEQEEDRYRKALRRKLEIHEGDRRLSSSDKYNLYLAASSELTALAVRKQIIKDAGDGLDEMVAAHKKIIESKDDQRDVLTFVAFVQALAEKAKKLQDLERARKDS